jgi:putative ABC transport system substrate-binding protein
MMLRRRDFITLLGGAAAAWPLAARAQQFEKPRRISFVIGLGDAQARARFAAFRQGLEALGWVQGRNIELVAWFGAADPKLNLTYVAELLTAVPDVVVTSNSTTVSELLKATHTIPIVITNLSDPVALGFAQSLSRPGGNVTGFTNFEAATGAKWLELLREIAPNVARAGVVIDPQEGDAKLYMPAIEAAASSLGIQLTTASGNDEAETQRSIDVFAEQASGGLIVPPGAKIAARRGLIMRLAAQYGMPAVYPFRYMAEEGGLVSYGPETLDLYRRPAAYVDRILKGTKPAELPIQQPTTFELIANLKTAKALGLSIPESVLLRADGVIE